MTLSQLLTHRAGLPHDGPWWRLPGQTTTEKRRALLTTHAHERPGEPAGVDLCLLQRRLRPGRPDGRAGHRRALGEADAAAAVRAARMASAGFGSPGRPGKSTSRGAIASLERRSEPTQQDNAPAMGPAGTVHCSVPDWAKFAALHLGGEPGKAKLLKPATFRALHTPPPGWDYAGGWIVVERSWAGGLRADSQRAATPIGTPRSGWHRRRISPSWSRPTKGATPPTACDEAVSADRALAFCRGGEVRQTAEQMPLSGQLRYAEPRRKICRSTSSQLDLVCRFPGRSGSRPGRR